MPLNDRLVFVVDDDAFITALVAGRLVTEGFRVRTFACGEECLAALGENPDLIILDHSWNGICISRSSRPASLQVL